MCRDGRVRWVRGAEQGICRSNEMGYASARGRRFALAYWSNKGAAAKEGTAGGVGRRAAAEAAGRLDGLTVRRAAAGRRGRGGRGAGGGDEGRSGRDERGRGLRI